MLKHFKPSFENEDENKDQTEGQDQENQEQENQAEQAELAQDQEVQDAAKEGVEAGEDDATNASTEVEEDDEDEEVEDARQEAEGVDEGFQETEGAADGARAIDKIADTVQSTEETGGAAEEVAAIAEVAIEGIYRRLGVKRPAIYALESFKSDAERLKATRLSVEDWKETANKIRTTVVEFFKKIIEQIKAFFGKIFSVSKRNKAAAQTLSDRLRKIGEIEFASDAVYKSPLAGNAGTLKVLDAHTRAILFGTAEIFDVVENFAGAVGVWSETGARETSDLRQLEKIFLPDGVVFSSDQANAFVEGGSERVGRSRTFGSKVLSKNFVKITFAPGGAKSVADAFNKFQTDVFENDWFKTESAKFAEFNSADLLRLLSEIEADKMDEDQAELIKSLNTAREKVEKRLNERDVDNAGEILPAALSALRQATSFLTTSMVERAAAISGVVGFATELIAQMEKRPAQPATESLEENAELPVESDGVNAEVPVTTEDEITEVQIETGVELADDYKDYLRKHRAVDQGDESVMGIAKGARLSVIQAHKDLSGDKTYPADAVPLQDLGNESYSLYSNSSGRVVQWQPVKGVGKTLAHSLESFLDKTVKAK